MKKSFALSRFAVQSTLALSGLATLAACGGGGGSSATAPAGTPQTATRAFGIQFAATENGQAVSCTRSMSTLGSAPVAAQLSDLRFYVSDVRLVDAQGKEVPLTLTVNDATRAFQSSEVALISLVNNPTGNQGACVQTALYDTLQGTAPEGTYTGVKMTLGMSEAANHVDPTAAATPEPLKNTAMNWSWTSGRKFVKIEVNPNNGVVRPAPAAPATTWNFHLGSTGCTVPAGGTQDQATCTSRNTATVSVSGFNPSTDRLSLNLNSLFQSTNVSLDQGGAVGCMSGSTDADCPTIFGVMGLTINGNNPVTRTGDARIFDVIKNVR